MLAEDRAEDYVIGTGRSHSVRDFVREAFAHAGLDWSNMS
jgi:GDPmannose 4,6-dehydratase